MDELSWRARLAKSNINILNVSPEKHILFVEFTYHPKPGTFKWCKTMFQYREGPMEDAATEILNKVLSLRKELEG